MPTLDPTRAAFVQKEYRWSISEDPAVKALYPNAEVYELNTQLSAADAATLSADLLAVLKVPSRFFKLIVKGTVRAEDFNGGLPRFTGTFPELNLSGVIVKVLSAEIDYMKNECALVVRT